MPTTINGVGTHYYGKSAVQVRPGVCRSCGKPVNLTSYNTRLWFVVVFIPIIPLGRKRIIDSCPSCRRHFVADLEKWEMTKQLETSGAMEKFRSNPTPETGMAAHKQFLGFHQINEAMELQKVLQEQFRDNAKVHIYLAEAMVHLGRVEEAGPFYDRALELRSDLPEARIGVAERLLRQQKLDEARQLLDFLEKPGAGQLYSLVALEHLGMAYQKAERHREALELFGRLLAELPSVSQHQGFRKMVKKSEKALGQNNTILPKAKFSLKGLFQARTPGAPKASVSPKSALIIGGCLVVVAVVSFMAANGYIRRHRTLYLVSAQAKTVEAEISGVGKVKIPPGITSIKLPEGHYEVKIGGAAAEKTSFDIHANYFDRWTGNPAWVLNAGGSAILVYQRVVYSKNPPPGLFRFHYGQTFQSFDRITHPFQSLPKTVSVQSSSEQQVLTQLELYRGRPANAFIVLIKDKRPEEALQLAEWRLQQKPEDEEMIFAYVTKGPTNDIARTLQHVRALDAFNSLVNAQRHEDAMALAEWQLRQKPQADLLDAYANNGTTNDLARMRAFLHEGLTNRPVNIEWHRTYQSLLLGRPEGEQLIKEYDDLLAAEPENSGLLYLRGRICGDHVLGTTYFERARSADAINPYPIFALAVDQTGAGNWSQAKPLLDQAIALSPGNKQFLEEWELTCIALGQFDPVEKERRAKLQADPTDWQSAFQLCDVLAGQGKNKEAKTAVDELVQANKLRYANSASAVENAARAHYLHAIGNLAELEKIERADKAKDNKKMLFYTLIEEGRPEEAAGILTADKIDEPLTLLSASMAWRLAGNSREAEKWQDKLLRKLRSGGADSARTAALLERKFEPTPERLSAISFALPFKAALMADLSLIYPSQRAALAAQARRFNIARAFPYHLVQRATETIP